MKKRVKAEDESPDPDQIGPRSLAHDSDCSPTFIVIPVDSVVNAIRAVDRRNDS